MQLIIPAEAAHDTVYHLGEVKAVSFLRPPIQHLALGSTRCYTPSIKQ